MFKGKKKRNNFIDFKNETALHKSNNVHEAQFNPVKKYYASVFYDGTSNLVTYESKFRSEATAYFNEVARLNKGHVEIVSVFK